MEVVIRPTPEKAVALTAQIVAQAVRAKPDLVLGLATGRTMERLYAELVRLRRDEALDLLACRTFNLDEYVGLPPADEGSYHYYMNRHFFRPAELDPERTHLPNGMASDLGRECRQYEERIRHFGGIDLQVLGIGKAGHIGFNEPLSAFQSRTREKALSPATIAQNSGLFADPARMPRRALTMGVGTILEAKRLLMLVTGESKAEILARAVEGPVTAMVSASAIQLHPRCVVICDEAAAGTLKEAEYYRWIFANEPEWESYRAAGL